MNAMTDFEELIDLSLLSVSQTSQGPISDILDNFCEEIDISYLSMGNIFKRSEPSVPNDSNETVPGLEEFERIKRSEPSVPNDSNETVPGLEEFERIFAKCLNNETKEQANNEQHVKNGGDEVPNETIIDLDEFESFLGNNCAENKISESREGKDDEVIDFDQFMSENLYFSNDSVEAQYHFLTTTTSDQQKCVGKLVVPYEVPVELDSDINKLEAVEHTKSNEVGDIIKISDSDDDGYNSSDFEFITEEEASKVGIFTKSNEKIIENSVKSRNALPKRFIFGKNEAKPSDYIKYSKYRYQRCFSRPSSEFHEIPEGEQYLDMFRGEYSPIVLNNLHIMRNKCVLPAVNMATTTEVDALLFRSPDNEEESKKYKDDADDCHQKILATYPGENRRKRRRH